MLKEIAKKLSTKLTAIKSSDEVITVLIGKGDEEIG